MSRTRAAALIFAAKFLSLGMSFLAVRAYLHALGEEGYGLYSYAFVLATYLGFADVGFSGSAVQFVAHAFGRKKPALAMFYHRAQLLLQLGVGLVLLVVAVLLQLLPPSWLQLDTPGGMAVLGLMCLNMIAVTLNGAFTGLFAATDRYQVIAVRESIITFFSAGAGIWAVYTHRNPVSLAAVTACAGAITLLVTAEMARRLFRSESLRPVYSKRLNRRLLSYALRSYVQRVAIQVFRTVDRLLIPTALSLSALGAYNVCYRLPDTLLNVVVPALQPVQPHLTREAARGPQAFGQALDRMSRMMVLMAVATLLVPSAFGYPILKIWLGNKMPVGGEWIVAFIGLSFALQIYYMALAYGVYAIERPEKLILPTILKGVALSALTIPVARTWGIVGVGALSAAIDLAQFVPYALYMRRACGRPYPIRAHLTRVGGAFGIALLVAAAAFALCGYSPLREFPLVCLGIAPFAVFGTVAVIVKSGCGELPEGIQKRWRRRFPVA